MNKDIVKDTSFDEQPIKAKTSESYFSEAALLKMTNLLAVIEDGVQYTRHIRDSFLSDYEQDVIRGRIEVITEALHTGQIPEDKGAAEGFPNLTSRLEMNRQSNRGDEPNQAELDFAWLQDRAEIEKKNRGRLLAGLALARDISRSD